MSKARNNSKKGGKRQKRLRSHGIDDDLPGEKKMKKNLDRFPPPDSGIMESRHLE
jgi:hypothetical protein